MKEFFKNITDWLSNLFGIKKPLSKSQNLTKDDEFNAQKKFNEEKLNKILEKINLSGIESLTKKEKKFLEDQS